MNLEYVMKKEAHPSLCEHWMPDDGTHEMSNNCWCGPIIENRDGPSIKNPGTTVRHRPSRKGIA